MPAGPKRGRGWPICSSYSSYTNCSSSSNRLDIPVMQEFRLYNYRDQSWCQVLVTQFQFPAAPSQYMEA